MRSFPPLSEASFAPELVAARNYQALRMPPNTPILNEKQFEKRAQAYCEGYEKFPYQYLAQQHLSPTSPYRGLLVYHGLGFGKTCSAITFAEAMLAHTLKEVWVITSGALEDNFRSQLYRPGAPSSAQCSGSTYASMGMGARPIDARYKFMTYDRFGSLVKDKAAAHTLKDWAKNRTIIIDEAHNLRNPTVRGSIGLETFLKAAPPGANNRLILMTATPMFDRADEIAQLLYYLVLNDRRTDLPMTPKAIQEAKFSEDGANANAKWLTVFPQLCSNYISYVKGRNPFTLAVRLSPTASGMTVYTPQTVPKLAYSFGPAAEFVNGTWLKWVEDGILPTPLSPTQSYVLHHLTFIKESVKRKMAAAKTKAAKATKKKATEEESVHIHTNILEATNILYPSGPLKKPKYLVGSDGFQSVFKSLGPNGPYEYYGSPVFYPSAAEGYLKTFAGKLYRAAELLQSSQGIVLIYSHFIWSGVMPMAMVLEHLGYTRYKESKLLKFSEASLPPTAIAQSLPKTPGRSYAIFCSDPQISGVDTFQGLLNDINDPSNQHGERVKVILMSPVASEGISFANVREVHILDPWFHLNRLEQVIGRSIRTCSHKTLPLAERNVSVFLHASEYDAEVAPNHETYDLYTYRMAADKKETATTIERMIQNHALDCSLQKPLHYYAKSLFPFELRLTTSQNRAVAVRLGDPEEAEPVCAGVGAPPSAGERGWRKEIYEPMKDMAKERLRKRLLAVSPAPIPTQSLLSSIDLPIEIGWLGLEALAADPPPGLRVVSHRLNTALAPTPAPREGIRRMALTPVAPSPGSAPRPAEPEGCEELVEMMLANDMSGMENETVIMVAFLLTLNVACWEPFAQRVVSSNLQNPLTHTLWKNGWLIAASEVASGGPGAAAVRGPTEWVGYLMLDLLTSETETPWRIYGRDATRAEKAQIINGRRPLPSEPTAPYGFYTLHKRAGQPPTFKLKLVLDTNAKREKTGMVGTSIPSGVLREWIDRLQAMFPTPPPIVPNFTPKENRTNRTYLVSWVAYYLGMLGRLRIPPIYKFYSK